MNKKFLVTIILSVMFLSVVVSASLWSDFKASITGNAVRVEARGTCTETDSGEDIHNAGVARIVTNSGILIRRDRYATFRTRNIVEFWCEGEELKSNSIYCPEGREYVDVDSATNFGVTRAARCKGQPEPVQPNACTDSDSGTEATLAGYAMSTGSVGSTTLIDVCTDDSTLREAVCTEDGDVIYQEIRCRGDLAGICTSENITVSGQTMASAKCEPQPLTCVDGDDDGTNLGKDFSSKGMVTTSDARGIATDVEDRCRNSNTVIEYFCEGDLSASEEHRCTDICIDGHCEERDILCTDTDGGKNYTVQGTVTNSFGASLQDSCMGDNTLLEFTCIDLVNGNAVSRGQSRTRSRILSNYVTCRDGCQDGVCVNGRIQKKNSLDNWASL